jgi:uncharacterized membrane protein YhaH (DUF805 family)|tara:strand:+ start:60 stop:533 length:474 start_codon:yes stop_codon:yes gene_type:complete
MKSIKLNKESLIKHWNNMIFSFKSSIRNTFNFKSSSSRFELYYFTAATILIAVAINIVTLYLFHSFSIHEVAIGILTLILFIPSLALLVRRLNDVGVNKLILLLPILALLSLITCEEVFKLSRIIMKIPEAIFIITLLYVVGQISRKGRKEKLMKSN